jgi:hypothetical protein
MDWKSLAERMSKQEPGLNEIIDEYCTYQLIAILEEIKTEIDDILEDKLSELKGENE